MITRYALIFGIFTVLMWSMITATTAQQQQPPVPILAYAAISHPYDLRSPQALTHYLPARLKAFEKEIAKNGITTAMQQLEHDPDFDSFLFVLDAEKPYSMLAYSRTPAFTNKTPQELQKLLAPQCNSPLCDVSYAVDQIASIANQITTYTAYWWPVEHEQPKHYMAYATTITHKEKKYVIGVTMRYPRAEIQIVLPHRINQVIKRIKKEGLETIAPTLNNNLDYGYFFVIDLAYPNRFITHREKKWAGLTPKEARDVYNPHCTAEDCDVAYIVNGLVGTARDYKEGFYIYLWKNRPELPASLKIAYVKTFDYKGKKYLVGTGLPADIPGDEARIIMDYVNNGITLVKEVGLENAISAIKQSNTPERYLYIGVVKPPHKFVLHISPHFDGKTAAESQAYLSSQGQNKLQIADIFSKVSHVAQKGGGFLGYEWFEDPQNPQSTTTFKVAYTKPFTYNGVDYTMTAGVPIDQAQAAAAISNQAA